MILSSENYNCSPTELIYVRFAMACNQTLDQTIIFTMWGKHTVTLVVCGKMRNWETTTWGELIILLSFSAIFNATHTHTHGTSRFSPFLLTRFFASTEETHTLVDWWCLDTGETHHVLLYLLVLSDPSLPTADAWSHPCCYTCITCN